MNRITGITGDTAIGGSRAKAAAGPNGFTIAAGNQTAEAPAPAQAAQPAGLAGMLALQEAEAEIMGNRNGKRHGLAVLDGLQELQRGLLGADSQGEIAGLAQLAENTPFVADAGLAGLLAAIRLRAKIELLRRGMETG